MSIQSLPNEICCQILDWCDLHSYVRLSRTCRQWYALGHYTPFWEYLGAGAFVDEKGHFHTMRELVDLLPVDEKVRKSVDSLFFLFLNEQILVPEMQLLYECIRKTPLENGVQKNELALFASKLGWVHLLDVTLGVRSILDNDYLRESLLDSTRRGFEPILDLLLNKCPVSHDIHNETLRQCLIHDNESSTKRLLNQGAISIDTKSQLISHAARKGWISTLSIALKDNALVGQAIQQALRQSMSENYSDATIELLIQAYIPPSTAEIREFVFLFAAHPNECHFNALLKKYPPMLHLFESEENGCAVVAYTIRNEETAVEELLRRGTLLKREWYKALDIALEKCNASMIKLLLSCRLENDETPALSEHFVVRALLKAASSGHRELAKVLLHSRYIPDRIIEQAVELARSTGHLEILEVLTPARKWIKTGLKIALVAGAAWRYSDHCEKVKFLSFSHSKIEIKQLLRILRNYQEMKV